MTDERPKMLFDPAREVREIPRGWRHPRDAHGRFIPLSPADMPAPGEDPDIVAYETVSEGTPMSLAFAMSQDLVLYCAEHCTTFGDHKADAEAWAASLFGDAAVTADGIVIAQDR